MDNPWMTGHEILEEYPSGTIVELKDMGLGVTYGMVCSDSFGTKKCIVMFNYTEKYMWGRFARGFLNKKWRRLPKTDELVLTND